MTAPSSQKSIKQAAIRRDGVVWTLPRPARHHHILWIMNHVDNTTTPDHPLPLPIPRGEQGFVDEDGIFLNRKEAFIVATSYGQFLAEPGAPPSLFSEDLW